MRGGTGLKAREKRGREKKKKGYIEKKEIKKNLGQSYNQLENHVTILYAPVHAFRKMKY